MAYKQKLPFGLIVGTRNIFSSKLADEARGVLLKEMERIGYNYVILPSSETPMVNIETVKEAQKCARLFSDKRDKIDGIIVVLLNFSL